MFASTDKTSPENKETSQQETGNIKISNELVRQVADQVILLLQADLKVESERRRTKSHQFPNKFRGGA